MSVYDQLADRELFERLKLWHEIEELNAEIQRRYPLSTTPL